MACDGLPLWLCEDVSLGVSVGVFDWLGLRDSVGVGETVRACEAVLL